MATFAAHRLTEIGDNVTGIIAIELLAAAQGIEFHHPLISSPLLCEVIKEIRLRAANWETDRFFAPDITAVKDLIKSGILHTYVPDLLPSIPS